LAGSGYNDGENYAKFDDVTTPAAQQLMTSGVNALGRLVQMTYKATDNDDADDDYIRRPQHHHHHHRHRQG